MALRTVHKEVSAASARSKAAAPVSPAASVRLLEEETARLRSLLDDLRHLRMLELPSSVDWQPVDLADLCQRIGRLFAAPAQAAGLDLQVQVAKVHAISDPRFIERVLTNFLTNAVRYTPAGGTVHLEVAPSAQNSVAVSVRDSGIGIPPEEHHRIFDRFHRIDTARDRVSGGTGLGLAITRSAAVNLGGRIELDSEPGRGSEFRLILPANPAITPTDLSSDRNGTRPADAAGTRSPSGRETSDEPGEGSTCGHPGRGHDQT